MPLKQDTGDTGLFYQKNEKFPCRETDQKKNFNNNPPLSGAAPNSLLRTGRP